MAFTPNKVTVTVTFDPPPAGAAEEAEAKTLAKRLIGTAGTAQSNLQGNLGNNDEPVNCEYTMTADGDWILVCQ